MEKEKDLQILWSYLWHAWFSGAGSTTLDEELYVVSGLHGMLNVRMQHGTIYNVLFANDRVDFSFNEKCTESTKKFSKNPKKLYVVYSNGGKKIDVNLPKERNPQVIAGRHDRAANVIVQQYEAHQNVVQMAPVKRQVD